VRRNRVFIPLIIVLWITHCYFLRNVSPLADVVLIISGAGGLGGRRLARALRKTGRGVLTSENISVGMCATLSASRLRGCRCVVRNGSQVLEQPLLVYK
jgi:hypothetical protein